MRQISRISFCGRILVRGRDIYGGSVQNRVRSMLEVTEAEAIIVKTVGANRVGIRFSPWDA